MAVSYAGHSMNNLYAKALENLAQAQKAQIDSYFKHPGEKGRMNEQVVVDLLRQISPKKYSFGTGFIIDTRNDISPQCDIIVYDAFHNQALFGEATANVYPIECVYAFIEVKTTLNKIELTKTLNAIEKIRSMAQNGKYYKSEELVWEKTDNDYIGQNRQVKSTIILPPRSFVFAFQSTLPRKQSTLSDRLRSECNKNHKHFHGMFMLDSNTFVRRLPNKDKPAEFEFDSGIKRFIWQFLEELNNFPMNTMDLEKYFI